MNNEITILLGGGLVESSGCSGVCNGFSNNAILLAVLCLFKEIMVTYWGLWYKWMAFFDIFKCHFEIWLYIYWFLSRAHIFTRVSFISATFVTNLKLLYIFTTQSYFRIKCIVKSISSIWWAKAWVWHKFWRLYIEAFLLLWFKLLLLLWCIWLVVIVSKALVIAFINVIKPYMIVVEIIMYFSGI